ncbi:MAG: DUF4397 domain-containing protein [Pedobacter sp.]|uniref:DUF4397 domain-containing protein n=1 Tax=Pedobacter sp. TaxID=1411316 RepID=UPI003569B232
MKPSFLLSSKAGKVFMVVCLSVIVLVASCGKKYDPVPEPVGDAKIRFVNALHGSAAQDFYVNGTKKSTTPLAYGATSENLTITSGQNAFNLNDAGSTVVNASIQGNVSIGDRFTFLYFKHPEGKLVLAPVPDVASNPVAGKANVRFINLNTTLNSQLTVHTVGVVSPTIPSLGAQAISDFFPVDAGTKFSFSATGWLTATDYDGAIVAGKTYTIWIDGNTDPANKQLIGHIFEQN